VDPGASVILELKARESGEFEDFEGFFVQARDAQDNVVGAFEILDNLDNQAKYVNCNNKPQSAVTHARSNYKSSVKLKWRSPTGFRGKVKMLATFVTDYRLRQIKWHTLMIQDIMAYYLTIASTKKTRTLKCSFSK